MAIITAPAAGRLRMDLFNFDRLTDFDSVIVTQTSSLLAIDVDGYRYAFTGSGVRYNGFGEPIGGVITGFTFSQGGQTLFQISGVSVPATTFYQATYSPNDPMPLFVGGNDDYRGGPLNDVIHDPIGHDVLLGGGGDDQLDGGPGNDHIYGHSPNGGDDGNDRIGGGAGSDYIQANAGNDIVGGGDGSDRILGGAGDDTLAGGFGNDSINGNRGNDRIDGYVGNDLLRGGQGDDRIQGGPGRDTLMGDLGNDTLWGGGEADVLTGGEGADMFQIYASGFEIDHDLTADGLPVKLNVVTDFTPGEDKLNFFARRFNDLVVGPDQATAVGAASYASSIDTDDLIAVGVGSDTYVFIGGYGDGIGLAVLLMNVDAAALRLDDFDPSGYYQFPASAEFIF